LNYHQHSPVRQEVQSIENGSDLSAYSLTASPSAWLFLIEAETLGLPLSATFLCQTYLGFGRKEIGLMLGGIFEFVS
jgi:hypothetical protein